MFGFLFLAALNLAGPDGSPPDAPGWSTLPATANPDTPVTHRERPKKHHRPHQRRVAPEEPLESPGERANRTTWGAMGAMVGMDVAWATLAPWVLVLVSPVVCCGLAGLTFAPLCFPVPALGLGAALAYSHILCAGALGAQALLTTFISHWGSPKRASDNTGMLVAQAAPLALGWAAAGGIWALGAFLTLGSVAGMGYLLSTSTNNISALTASFILPGLVAMPTALVLGLLVLAGAQAWSVMVAVLMAVRLQEDAVAARALAQNKGAAGDGDLDP